MDKGPVPRAVRAPQHRARAVCALCRWGWLGAAGDTLPGAGASSCASESPGVTREPRRTAGTGGKGRSGGVCRRGSGPIGVTTPTPGAKWRCGCFYLGVTTPDNLFSTGRFGLARCGLGDRGTVGPAWPGCAGTVPRARHKPGVSSGRRGWFWFSCRRRAFHSASCGCTATLPHPLHTGISFILSLPLPIPSSSCFSMEICATAIYWIFLFSFHTAFFFSDIFV